MTTTPPAAWRAAARAPNKRSIATIAVHCTATPEGRPHSAADIRSWHRRVGWSDIGYHFLVRIDGTIEAGRPIAKAGAHVAGHNMTSIGVVYVGGMSADMSAAKDTRTAAQKAALVDLLTELKLRYPHATVQGHRDYPGVRKACPSFDAKREYSAL